MENVISIDNCQKCAGCCKKFPFIELSQSEIDALAKATGLALDVFTISKEKDVAEYFMQFKENGDCFFLQEDKGCFSCAVYAARPGICARYPSNPKQQDACDVLKKSTE